MAKSYGNENDPGCCVREPKAKVGLIHLTPEGLRPEAVRCIRPPETLGFPIQLPGEVLMVIDVVARKKILFKFWKSPFNFWKQGPFKKLFKRGCYGSVRGQKICLEIILSMPQLHCVPKKKQSSAHYYSNTL